MEIKKEDIYKFITQNTTDIVYTVELDSTIKFYNKAIEKIFETSIEEIERNHYTEMMLPKDKEFARKLHEDRLNGKSSLFEHGFETPNGKIVYLEISANPIFNDKGEVIASLGIARDITERRKAQDELKNKKHELEEMVRMKDKFLSIIAHDLRDPFNILIGYSDLILEQLEDYSPEKFEKHIQAINVSSNNAYNLLNNILDWSKAESGNISYRPEEVNLKKLIGFILTSASTNALAKNITLKSYIQDDYIASIDENMIKTVLRNLINNAIKFSFKNSDVVVEVLNEKLQYIIHVIDTGIGIKEDVLHQIFSPEFNTSESGTANERGTGLGLKICKEFVNKWGGRIWVESEHGKGSSFSFSIPK
ncbi:MAG: PAS domain-containing sensor histidine kinase [Bacteroidetes bacterium]|nr:PAS domain-containing sensor histidine kinase [Bacteroidota bacterium]